MGCLAKFVLMMLWLRPLASASGAVYQYSVQDGDRRVYLWVPPTCGHVRGLIVAFKNLTEQLWLEDPVIRAAASDECLGIVWVGNGHQSQLSADVDDRAGQAFLQMEQHLAEVSELPEIANAPVIAMGHSAHGQFAWKFAEWAPERTIAAIPIKTVPLPPDLQLRGVPLLYLVGETTEWPQFRESNRVGDRDYFWQVVRNSAIQLRQADPAQPIAVAVDPGGGHFDWSPQDAKVVAMFIRKACALRLHPGIPDMHSRSQLRTIPFESGWLMDSGGIEPDRYPAASVSSYWGPKDRAYWIFDGEMAASIAALQGDRKPRRIQMLSFVQDGVVLPVAVQGFAPLEFEPDADDVSFPLNPVFLDVMPRELNGAGTKIGNDAAPIQLTVITGPIEQIGPRSFRYAESREAGSDAWIEEEAAGNDVYRRAVQPGKMHFRTNEGGAEQAIHFPPIPNQRAGTHAIKLHAESTSGLPVRFYVISGPARITGNELEFSEVPRCGAKQMQVIVMAYQEGRPARGDQSAVRAATPVTRQFLLGR